MKTLAIAFIATIALLSAATAVHAESPTGCTPAVEASDAGEGACAPDEPEEPEEAEEAELLEYEEAGLEEVGFEGARSVLAPAATASEPASSGRRVPRPKLTVCRRASAATIRAQAKRIRKLKGERRRSAERRLERALCR